MTDNSKNIGPVPSTLHKRILKLPEGYKYTNLKVSKNLIQFYCNSLETESQIKTWANLFANLSCVKWNPPHIYKYAKNNLRSYRISFKCQEKLKINETQIQCPVRLLVKRIFDINSREEKVQTLVLLYNEHNHQPMAKDEIIDEEIEKKIQHLYADGHTPGSVYSVLSFDAMIELGSNFKKIHGVKRLLPSFKYCRDLFYIKKQKKMIAEKTNIDSLKNTLKKWVLEMDGCAVVDNVNNVKIITLVTPFMRHVHFLYENSRRTISLEKAVSNSKSNLSMYILSLQTILGELPIGYIIVSSQMLIYLKKGLEQLLSLNEKLLFFGSSITSHPKYIIINENFDGSMAKIVKEVWPTSNIIMSPLFVVKTIWMWLNDYSTDVNVTLFLAFKNVLTARTEKDVLKSFEELQFLSFPEFTNYFSTFWDNKNTWCLYYLQDVLSPSYLEKTYLSYLVQDVKNIFIKSLEKFNLYQLINLIIMRLDMYYNKRIVDTINKNVQVFKLQTLLPETSISWETIYTMDDKSFLIKSSENTNYIIDISLGFCTCSVGMNGTICEHLSAVISYYIKSIEGTHSVYNITDLQHFLNMCLQEKILNNSNKTIDLSRERSLHDHTSITDNIIAKSQSENNNKTTNVNTIPQLKGKCSKTNTVKECNNLTDSDNISISNTNFDYEYASYTEEVTATDVMRIMNSVENPFSQDLRTVFREIVDRVRNNPDLLQAAKHFCINYRKYCDRNTTVMSSLCYLGELLKYASEHL